MRKTLHAGFLSFCLIEIIHQMLIALNSLQIPVDFLTHFQEFPILLRVWYIFPGYISLVLKGGSSKIEILKFSN